MENTIKDLEKSQKEISVKLTAEEMLKYVAKATDVIAEGIELDGFRKGKAPKDLVKQKVGDEKIYEEAAHMAIEESYLEILKATPDLVPLGHPRAEITKLAPGNDFEYKMIIAVMPEVDMGEYKAVKIEKHEHKIEDEKVESELKVLQKRRAAYITKEEQAEKGDRVEIDFEVRVGGVKIEGGESKNHPLVIGEGKFIPGFEEQLIGMKKDDVKEFELKFPEHYKEDLAGKEAQFKVVMDLVQKVELPQLDDAFAQSFGKDIKGIDDFKARIRKDLETEQQAHCEHEMEHEIMDAVVKGMKVELPDVLIEGELNNMLAEFRGNLTQAGMDFEQYLGNVGATPESIREEWKPLAEKKAKEGLAIREIAKLEKIEADEKEISEKVDETLKSYPNEEEIRGKIDMRRFRDYIADDILRGKVMELLKENALKK